MTNPVSTADKIHAAHEALEIVRENFLEPLIRATPHGIASLGLQDVLVKVEKAVLLLRSIDEKEMLYLESCATDLEDQRENIRKRL